MNEYVVGRTNARRERIRSVTVTVRLDGRWPGGRHVRGIAAVTEHALSRRDQLYRRSSFAAAEGLGLAVLLKKAESNLCSAVCFLGAGRELKIILGGSSGGRMQPVMAGLCWSALA